MIDNYLSSINSFNNKNNLFMDLTRNKIIRFLQTLIINSMDSSTNRTNKKKRDKLTKMDK